MKKKTVCFRAIARKWNCAIYIYTSDREVFVAWHGSVCQLSFQWPKSTFLVLVTKIREGFIPDVSFMPKVDS